LLSDIDLHPAHRHLSVESDGLYNEAAEKIINQIPEGVVTRNVCHVPSFRMSSDVTPVPHKLGAAESDFKGACDPEAKTID
jgi:hypothetical protein